MIGIQLLCVGSLKESWMRDGCGEYLKRISLWSRAGVTELEECRLPQNPSGSQIEDCVRKEGERILAKLSGNTRIIALCIEGKEMSSEALAGYLEKAAVDGSANAAFVIGGSWGLSEAVKGRADLRLSMSPMTFPHQLARLMICEQIYRALSISANTKYHK